ASGKPATSAAALISVFAIPVMVPTSLRNLFMNAAYVRYSVGEIARFVRNSSRMSPLLESLSSTLSASDQVKLRKNLLSIAAGKELVDEPEADEAPTACSPFSVVNNCVRSFLGLFEFLPKLTECVQLPIDLLSIEPSTTSDAVVRFQVNINDPSTIRNTIQMSASAELLLGYSVVQIQRAIESTPAPKSQSSVTFINVYWK
ncbi:hypothetical protein BVRB_025500, partial [Beta vulgaris subsp. vulgaris]